MMPDLAALMGTETSTRSDRSGRYEFEDLKADGYRIEVTHASRAMPMEFPVDVREGDNKLNIELPLSIVMGRVHNEAGEPLAGMKVTAKRADGPARQGTRVMLAFTTDGESGDAMISSGFGDDTSVTTDEDGLYELRGVTPDTDLVVEARGRLSGAAFGKLKLIKYVNKTYSSSSKLATLWFWRVCACLRNFSTVS